MDNKAFIIIPLEDDRRRAAWVDDIAYIETATEEETSPCVIYFKKEIGGASKVKTNAPLENILATVENVRKKARKGK